MQPPVVERPHEWQPQPEVDAFYEELTARFLASCPLAAALAARMLDETGTRFRDWIDHIAAPGEVIDGDRLEELGFLYGHETQHSRIIHPAGIFPPLRESRDGRLHVAIRVDSVVDFFLAQGLRAEIEGEPMSHYRSALLCECDASGFHVVERRGYNRFDPHAPLPGGAAAVLRARELFRLRDRRPAEVASGFHVIESLYKEAAHLAGDDMATELFFEVEREFWEGRNGAARVQKARQDSLGLGWANHDHHTYRSSRVAFAPMIRFFEQMGFYCRERFYAGREAGWGAQVMEHPVTGIVIFADVDLSPEELVADFAHAGLAPRRELGTIGLWCALHGESLFEAGMHHLECTFDFDLEREQLAAAGVALMKPFTDLPYLRQAFTQGEIWPVAPERIERLAAAGQISKDDALRFEKEGAIGSHLENLERNWGFKGFNQQGVNEIIAGTDPRLQPAN